MSGTGIESKKFFAMKHYTQSDVKMWKMYKIAPHRGNFLFEMYIIIYYNVVKAVT